MPLKAASVLKQIGRYSVMVIVTGTPFAPHIFPQAQHSVPLFPPMGGANLLLNSFASLIFAGCAVLAAHQGKRRSASSKYRRGFGLSLVGFAFYSILTLAFVVRIDFPDHTYQYRSVGFWRTDLGRHNSELKNAPPAQAIKVVGTEEEAIETVWEPWSIYLVRFFLFAFYVFTLGSLNYGFGAVKVEMPDGS